MYEYSHYIKYLIIKFIPDFILMKAKLSDGC